MLNIKAASEFVADNSTNPKRLLIRATSGGDQALQTDSNAATFYEVGKLDQANLGLLLKSGGTMTGQLLGDDGSLNGSPAYSFDGDTDTGMFRNSANTLGFSTAAVERAIIDANGLTLRARGDLRLGDSDSSHYIGIQAPATVTSSQQVTFTAPVDGTNGQVLQTNGSGVLSFATFGSVPVGAIFCMPENAVPTGYVECNGQSLDKTQSANTALFSLIQYKYGGSGNNFNVPDLRGEFVRGWASNTTDSTRDQGRDIGTGQSDDITAHNHSYSNSSITVSGGSHTHSIRKISLQPSIASVAITLGQGQSYQIGYATSFSGDTNQAINTSGSLSLSGNVGITINNTGGSETRPRNVALMYIIKL